MRDIERGVAALLLAGAVAAAVALPRLAAGPTVRIPIAGVASQRVTTVVEAAPLPEPKPRPKVVRVVATPIVIHRLAVASPHAHAVKHVQRAAHVAAVAPDVVQAPAPVQTPAQPTPAVAAPTMSPAAVVVAPSPATLPAIGKGHGKAKGHDKGDVATPIELPQVQTPPPPPANNGNGKAHGHDKGA